MSIASFRERLLDFRSCCIVVIHIVQWHPGGLLQFFKGKNHVINHCNILTSTIFGDFYRLSRVLVFYLAVL